ncbi:MAG: hypothetical protein GXO26_03340 [Crenarchaeota archaeon]|nr:hypothetical protein [Thermoproteota archaeon]
MINKTYIAILGGELLSEEGFGCIPLDSSDVILTFNYIKVHYDNRTKIYYMKKIVKKYVKYVKIVYQYGTTVYPHESSTLLIKFKPKFNVRPGMCYNLLILSRSGAYWYVNYAYNEVKIIS